MSDKGERTKQLILAKASDLFAERGFSCVTMKDVCDHTGLSRGGLYRYFASTAQIFEEIIQGTANKSGVYICEKMKMGVPADQILQEAFSQLEQEMLQDKNSLSFAIYEYAMIIDAHFFEEMAQAGREKWRRLFLYGKERGEFQEIDYEPIIDILLYSYQGVRMWSRVAALQKEQIHCMLQTISECLLIERKSLMTEIILVRPSLELKDKAIEYRQEHFDFGETIINGSELFDQTESYEEWLKAVTNNTSTLTVNPNWVVTDTFFAWDLNTKKIVGIIDLRHTLNDFLRDFGNCGYSVRPSFRGRGIATQMLGQLLTIAKEAGLKKIHLSVEQDNIASVKTIQKYHGVYERTFEHDGKRADVYQIIL
ncbi:MAG: hypothetical protein PWP24_538 [Clostridiales bacterium]|nr:hypothetical protein [Clostridiales bacterium]